MGIYLFLKNNNLIRLQLTIYKTMVVTTLEIVSSDEHRNFVESKKKSTPINTHRNGDARCL